jgi:hypothetical protein
MARRVTAVTSALGVQPVDVPDQVSGRDDRVGRRIDFVVIDQTQSRPVQELSRVPLPVRLALDFDQSEMLNAAVIRHAQDAQEQAQHYIELLLSDGLKGTPELSFAQETAAAIAKLAKGKIEPDRVADVRLRIEEILSRVDHRLHWEIWADLHFALSQRLNPLIAQEAVKPEARTFTPSGIRYLIDSIRKREGEHAQTVLAPHLAELDTLVDLNWHDDHNVRNRGLTILRNVRALVKKYETRESISAFLHPGVGGLDSRAQGHIAVPKTFHRISPASRMRLSR